MCPKEALTRDRLSGPATRPRIFPCRTTSGLLPRTRNAQPRMPSRLTRSAGWIEEHIAAPRRDGRDIFVDGQVFSWDRIGQIHITQTEQTSAQLIPQVQAHLSGVITATPDKWFVANDADDVTEQFLTGPPGTGLRPNPGPASTYADNRKAVMVIYGHDTEANTAIFDYLRAIGLQPREWSQLVQLTGSGSPYIGEVLDRAFQGRPGSSRPVHSRRIRHRQNRILGRPGRRTVPGTAQRPHRSRHGPHNPPHPHHPRRRRRPGTPQRPRRTQLHPA